MQSAAVNYPPYAVYGPRRDVSAPLVKLAGFRSILTI